MINFRKELEKLMLQTLTDEANYYNWKYRAVRPMAVPSHYTPISRVTGDCSKGVQYLCRWVGAPDPMGNGYGVYGNSETLCMNLQHLDSPGDLLIGDIVTFGYRGNEHAAMVLKTGPDPLLWSFGHQGAPNTYLLSQDRRVKQYLRNPLPTYMPTPEEKLRSMTGYWSWVQWRLAEGSWKNYKRTDKKVRPNVPRRIPAAWWRDYVRFLAARKKPNEPSPRVLTS